MPPNFRADQPTGAGSGSAGAARSDLWEDEQIELHDVGTGMVVSREWILEDKPAGSSSTVTSETSTPAFLTPTVLGAEGGSYLITLRYDGVDQKLLEDGSRNPQYAEKNKTFVLVVTKDSSGVSIPNLFPLPAFSEEVDHSSGISGRGPAPGKGHAPLLVALRTRILQLLADLAQVTVDYSTLTADVYSAPVGQDTVLKFLSGKKILLRHSGQDLIEIDSGPGDMPTVRATSNAADGFLLKTVAGTLRFECEDGSEVVVTEDDGATILYSLGSVALQLISTTGQTLGARKLGVLSGSATSVDLPAANSVAPGVTIMVKKVRGFSSDVTINPDGSDTIDGEATYTLAGDGTNVSFISDGVDDWLAFPPEA